jgi:multiple sugar transport system ATP-binding protein
MAGLRLEHIYKVYPNGTKAVSDFTMEIEDQEFIVFVGPSGCGKSTTLRMIAGLEDISAGELYIGDRIVNDVEPKDRDIAMVFQNYALYPHMTVYENMAFGLKLRHVPNAEIHEKVLWAAKVLDLTEYLDRKPKAMSGGQRQRVALGRAILRNPKVMLLDEPLSNLDAKLRSTMRSEIAKLHEELKTTFIYVTHDQVEAMTLGTRVVVMKLGKVMQIDTPKNLYDYPQNLFVAGFIGTPQMSFFRATLNKIDDEIKVDFKYCDKTLLLPQNALAKVKPQYFDGKSEVVVGIRCEHLSLDPEVVSKSKYLLGVKVSHFEELGSETLIYGDINNEGDGFTESATRVIIKGRSNYGLKKGQIVHAAVEIDKIHMFDAKTEETINPRIPTDNLITVNITNNKIVMGELTYQLPDAIKLSDGKYDLLIPTSAITLGNDKENSVLISNVETVEHTHLAGITVGEQLVFTTTNEPLEVGGRVSVELDFTQLEFRSNGEVVKSAISEYDKVNAIFMNHLSAKQFVGDAYDSVVEERLNAVRAKYDPMLEQLKAKYEADCKVAQTTDTSKLKTQNNAKLVEAKTNMDNEIAKLKAQLKLDVSKINKEHAQNNARITSEVNALYEKIKDDEIKAFETFKLINKDRDVYRKRLEEINEFKANHKLERMNELDKRINLEAVRYESDLNAINGTYKRTVENLKKNYKALVQQCKDESNPIQALTKAYNANVKTLNSNYQNEINLANIIFFFKTNDLLTLSTDAISNKMIQGLGVKVFTKQYLVEIPHDAYNFVEKGGLELEVLELLNYGNCKYLHCKFDDGYGDKDIYILTENETINSKTVNVVFDVEKIHITEKSMEIKIY